MQSFRERAALAAERLTGWSLPVFALFAAASIAMQNIIFLAFAAWIFGMALRRKWRVTSTSMNWPLLLLGVALLFSSVLAGYLNPSLYGLRKVGLMAVFFLTVSMVDQPLTAHRYLNLYIIGAAICAAWSIVSHLLGWDNGRAESFSGDYMAAGGMYMLALVLATARFLYSRERSRWYWLGACLLLGVALAFTYTRSSWLGAAAALILLTGFRDWRLPVAGAVAVVLFLVAFPNNSISKRVATISLKATITSNTERRKMWDTAMKLIRDRPVLGYGVDNLSRDYGRYVNPLAIEQRPPHVHNTALQLTLNGGLIALFFFIWWSVAVLRLGWSAWRKNLMAAPERAGAALGITAAFAGFLVNGLFEFNFGASQVITIVYFLLGLLPVFAFTDPQRPDWVLPRRPRLLFLRPRFRGDVLLASAVPRLVKRDFPGARVDLLTEPASAVIAQGEPEWDEVISLPRKGFCGWWQAVRRMRRNNYDAVCDLFGNPRTAQLAWVSGARFKLGLRVTGWGVFFHRHTRPDRAGVRPAWESNFDILRSLNMKDLTSPPRWVVQPQDEAWVKAFLAERKAKPGKILGLFPGATHPAKRWPLMNFVEVARRAAREFGLRGVFVFGPLEQELRQEYVRAVGKYFLSAEDLTPGQLAALWSACAVVVSNDAFPMHLGPAVGTPTIGVFGPGEPDIWFPYPVRAGHRVIHMAPDCWPCHKDVCADNFCWRELTPERVVTALREILAEKSKRKRSNPAGDSQPASKKTTAKGDSPQRHRERRGNAKREGCMGL